MASVSMPPRQRMINMMYLVLTAMLALNVSAEILQAFESLRGIIARHCGRPRHAKHLIGIRHPKDN